MSSIRSDVQQRRRIVYALISLVVVLALITWYVKEPQQTMLSQAHRRPMPLQQQQQQQQRAANGKLPRCNDTIITKVIERISTKTVYKTIPAAPQEPQKQQQQEQQEQPSSPSPPSTPVCVEREYNEDELLQELLDAYQFELDRWINTSLVSLSTPAERVAKDWDPVPGAVLLDKDFTLLRNGGGAQNGGGRLLGDEAAVDDRVKGFQHSMQLCDIQSTSFPYLQFNYYDDIENSFNALKEDHEKVGHGLPLFGYAKYPLSPGLLVPDYVQATFLSRGSIFAEGGQPFIDVHTLETNWNLKDDVVFFRGSPTGFSQSVYMNKRIRFVTGLKNSHPLFDFGFSGFTPETAHHKWLDSFIAPKTTQEGMSKHRFLVDLEGNGSSFTRSVLILASKSLMIHDCSAKIGYWMPLLKDGENSMCIELSNTATHLREKIMAIVRHPCAQQIAASGYNLAKVIFTKQFQCMYLRAIMQMKPTTPEKTQTGSFMDKLNTHLGDDTDSE